MRQLSQGQQLLRDLFFMYLVCHNDEMDSQLMSDNNSENEEDEWDKLTSDLEEITDLLNAILSTRYLHCPNSLVREEFDMAILFQMPDYIFKQSVRTSKTGFLYVLKKIANHEVFAPQGI